MRKCGAALLIAALFLFIVNRLDDMCDGREADEILQNLAGYIDEQRITEAETQDVAAGKQIQEVLDGKESVFSDRMEIDDYEYIGILTIPALGLELPVMSEWDYPRLRVAPCRYSGSVETGNLIIFRHNYSRHFGRLNKK